MMNRLDNLIPELYPIIVSHLPLFITPSTLLSLAVVNHHTSAIVLPLLYARLLLKTEKDALVMFQRLLDEPELGKHVRELHSLSDLSLATLQGQTPFDVLTGLHQVITNGLLPYIHTLHLHLLDQWHDTHWLTTLPALESLQAGKLRSDFWSSLKANCPRLRGLTLRNFTEYSGHADDPSSWIDSRGLLELEIPDGITSLKLTFSLYTVSKKAIDKLLKKVEQLSPGLHTLDLEPGCTEGWTTASSLFALNFPRLRSLSLYGFTLNDPSRAMEFWKRHPRLEYLRIITHDDTRWFSKVSAVENFLPNLRHLKARFHDVRSLALILNQMISLTIYGTIKAQVPYLLRSVLPNGLPNLKTLKISRTVRHGSLDVEGAGWYETEFGDLPLADSEEANREVSTGYIHSIARGAPNLEEICLHGHQIELQRYVEIASEISQFRNLRRFYFQGPGGDFRGEHSTEMITGTKVLAEACGQLTMVVNLDSGWELPYVVARISRSEDGEVSRVDLGEIYYGVQIGNEDEAFPQSC